ncbi:hypothetical protein NQZ68_013334 [Dissostichus eleginoides]|nr:hypothetical protein NQZ68_013334 [Dissostichus eleginoides]
MMMPVYPGALWLPTFNGLRRHNPRDAPSDVALRDQLLLGLCEGPLAQALKVYARRNPDEGFAAIRQEALLLEAEYGRSQPEGTCHLVSGSHVLPNQPQAEGWKETLKREIMDDEKSQMQGLTQELMKEIKPLLQPVTAAPPPPTQPWRKRRQPTSQSNNWDEQAANGLEIPYTSYAVLDMEVEGVKIPGRGVVIVKDEPCTHLLMIGMNVVTACWNALFKWPGKSAFPPPQLKTEFGEMPLPAVEATMAEDRLLGYVRPAGWPTQHCSPSKE